MSKWKTISEALSDENEELIEKGKIALISRMSVRRKGRTIFCPLVYDAKEDKWLGISRSYGNNYKELQLKYFSNNRKVWRKERVMPKLPYNHELWTKIKKKVPFIKARNEILGRDDGS